MFICMCTKRKTGCLFFHPFSPRNALQASGRATRYWSGRPWSRGWFRELFFLGWGEPKHCPGKQRWHPEKTHQWDSKKMFLFQNSKRNKVGAGFSRILNSSPAISGCSYDWQDFPSKLIASKVVYQPFSPFFGIYCIFAWRLSFLIFHHLFP